MNLKNRRELCNRVSPEVPVPVPESSGVFLVPVPGTGTQIGSGSGSGQNFGSGETLLSIFCLKTIKKIICDI